MPQPNPPLNARVHPLPLYLVCTCGRCLDQSDDGLFHCEHVVTVWDNGETQRVRQRLVHRVVTELTGEGGPGK